LAPEVVVGALVGRLPRLYAVLDGARSWGVLSWLKEAGLPYQCLFDGRKAVELAEEAPYLLHLGDDRARLAQLVERVWGDAGGLFIESASPFYDLRRQLRRFLLVKSEAGDVLYFRYYDPRVAAPFMPTLDPTQIRTIFSSVVQAYLYEDDESGSLLEAKITQDVESGEPRVAVEPLLSPS
jgi:hypothetical protein